MSRALLFISDLHLGPATPRTTAALRRFLDEVAPQAGALYILGDFFEYWIGDDAAEEASSWAWSREIGEALRRLGASGVPVFLMHGNRDFLLGRRFAALAGATLLDDPVVLEAFGRRVVLSHGDALCTADTGYQRFRRLVRQSWLQSLFLSLPLSWRRAVAEWLRARSEGGRKTAGAMPWHDVDAGAAGSLLAEKHSAVLIHGHTHRPGCTAIPGGERWVLTDWDRDHGDRAGWLILDAEGLRYGSFGA